MNTQSHTTTSTGRVIIADSVPHVRTSLRTMLTLALGVTVVGEAGTAPELLDLLATTQAGIILVDRDLPGLDDAAVVEEIRQRAPQSRIVLCMVFDHADGLRACPITPDFTLSKSRGPEHWLQALNTMLIAHAPGVINLAVEKSPEMRAMIETHAPTDAPILSLCPKESDPPHSGR